MNDSLTFFPSEKFDFEPVSHIQHIERSFCSNFSCCNIALPDLHALFAHYDSQHLPNLLPPKYRIPILSNPPPLQLDMASYLSDDSDPPSPSPSLPSTPGSFDFSTPTVITTQETAPAYQNGALDDAYESSFTFPYSEGYYPDTFYTLPEYPTHEQCYNAAISAPTSPPAPSSCSSSSSSPTSLDFPSTFPTPASDPASIPCQGLDTSLDNIEKQQSSPFSTEGPMSPLLPSTIAHPESITLNRSSATLPAKPLAASTSTGHYKRTRDSQKRLAGGSSRGTAASKGAARKKERLYACPTAGCSKMYLNPNGLKYHQEKGKCKIETLVSGGESEDVPPTTTTTVDSTSVAEVSPPSELEHDRFPGSSPGSSSPASESAPQGSSPSLLPSANTHAKPAAGQYPTLLHALQPHHNPVTAQPPTQAHPYWPYQFQPLQPKQSQPQPQSQSQPQSQLSSQQQCIHQPQPRPYAQVAGAMERLEFGVREW